MNNTYQCPLIEHEVDDTICYDIQMVICNMINKSILHDYDFDIDETKVTNDRAEHYCTGCYFNQLIGEQTKTRKTAV